MIADQVTINNLLQRGENLVSSERYSEALRIYDSLLVLDPKNDEAWWGTGVSLRHLSRYQESLAAFEQALKVNPNNPKTWNSKGVALFELEQYEDALKAFDCALDLNPEDADVKTNRYETLKKIEEKNQREKLGEPIKDTPWLVTFLGCGGTIYWDTYYLTLFYLPIVPIARYSLKKIDGVPILEGTYKFYGKLKLHPWQQTWQALAGGAIGGLVIGLYLLTVI